jgi:hypothetical protein
MSCQLAEPAHSRMASWRHMLVANSKLGSYSSNEQSSLGS